MRIFNLTWASAVVSVPITDSAFQTSFQKTVLNFNNLYGNWNQETLHRTIIFI